MDSELISTLIMMVITVFVKFNELRNKKKSKEATKVLKTTCLKVIKSLSDDDAELPLRQRRVTSSLQGGAGKVPSEDEMVLDKILQDYVLAEQEREERESETASLFPNTKPTPKKG